jgi:cephalosporin-C deacetylase-like acetyl esterase
MKDQTRHRSPLGPEELCKEWNRALVRDIQTSDAYHATHWQPDFQSLQQYLKSVRPNRQLWQMRMRGIKELFNAASWKIDSSTDHIDRLMLTTANGFSVDALLALPDLQTGPIPLVVCLHGMDGTPEDVLGLSTHLQESYHDFGRKCVQQGYAVLAPRLLNTFPARGRINRLALLRGSHIWALESQMIRAIISAVLQRYPIDADRIAMWGISMGGAYTLYTMPLDARISVAIISGWFNHRIRKMMVEDPNYSCFLSTEEEHAFLPGLLNGFSDRDLVHLICPRPLLIQTGQYDSVSHPPLVEQEARAARVPYKELGLEERFEWDLFNGGHQVHEETALSFLKKWLRPS